MLQITIPDTEYFDEKTSTFFTVKGATLQLEHSLISVSKWESKWCKTFLSKKEKTREETIDYIKCMTLTQNVRPEVYMGLTAKHIEEVHAYIEAPMTAVYFTKENEPEPSGSKDAVTSELIYWWMIQHGIPFECQKWHLNRLLAFIRVCNVKGQKPSPVNTSTMLQNRAMLNAARKSKYNTRG